MQPFVDALVALFSLIAAHKIAISVTLVLLFAYWIFNAYASSLPAPAADDLNSKYAFKYRFLNKLAGNLDKVAKALHVPGSEDAPKP